MKLRDYQLSQVEKVREAFKKYKKVGLQLPTGAGKTEIAIEITKKLLLKKKKIAFAVSSIDLIDQTYNRFIKVFSPDLLSVIRANDPRKRNSKICIISIDTYVRRELIPEIQDVDFFIIDEAHEAVANKYKKLFKEFNGKYFLGLSATFQKVGNKYHGFWEHFIADIDGSFLWKEGHLPKLRIMCPDINYSLKGVKTSNGDYVNSEVYNKINTSAVYSNFSKQFYKFGMNKKSICFCVSIKHAKSIHNTLKDIGFLNSIIYHSDLTADEIKSAKKKIKHFDSNNIPFSIVSVDKVSKGFDLPSLSVAFMLRPTKSLVKYRQQVGRLTRGAEDVLLIDMTINTYSFGHPYILVSPVKNKKDKDNAKPSFKRCPECLILNALNIKNCECGYNFASNKKERIVEYVDGVELKEYYEDNDESKEKTDSQKNKAYFRHLVYFRARAYRKNLRWVFDKLYTCKGAYIYNYFRLKKNIEALEKTRNEQSQKTSKTFR